MSDPDIDPPDGIPDSVAETLAKSDDAQLRAVIHYAQRLLHADQPLTDEIEPREGERIVRTEDHGAYTFVVVERENETGGDRGPFAYRLKFEPDLEGVAEGKYRWHYLGRVHGGG
jgi:hypothetical protein